MSRAAVEQAARSWLKLALGINDQQVILARPKGPRPPLPYLTVRVSALDGKATEDERVDGLSGADPTATIQGERTATVEIQGYGAGCYSWFEAMELSLSKAAIRTQLDTDAVTFVALGAVQDLAQLVDTGFEERWSRDYECRYRVSSSAETLTYLTDVGVDAHVSRYFGDPSPWNPDLSFTP